MYLDRIVETKRMEVAALKERFSLTEAERQIAELPACLGFGEKLARGRNRPMGLIAEVKKASPSKGLIREDFHPVNIARTYEEAGADCLSVLTDVEYFQGSNRYLQEIREAVRLPILRKDFTIDYRQIYEARLIGADAVLLIAAILTAEEMKEMLQISSDLGLDALVEVHDREELELVLELDTSLIGINNRNLKTFVTDLAATESLIRHIPQEATIVSESGISRPEEIRYLLASGAHAVLVGEHFMRQHNIGWAVKQLMGEPGTEEVAR
ncbi:indole-3-glycerol phosphate synthase TrpC [Paenibacillus sp. SAFN-117]|uniref:indole-3-glycerol phosphate synthase TrpC n=1 Tax=Paenibacillus sp. SAFN-117 TaxID=3436860 RepID=UPI003F7F7F6F